VPFRVVLLLDGKSYNYPLGGSQRNGTEPLVEFYDLRYHNVRGFTPDGQFVSRYYLESLVGRDRRYGLDLQGDVSDWTIDASTMLSVILWLREVVRRSVADPLAAEQAKKRVLVRDRLRELLPNHNIARGVTSINLETAADLLDIIESLGAQIARLQTFQPPIDESSVDL